MPISFIELWKIHGHSFLASVTFLYCPEQMSLSTYDGLHMSAIGNKAQNYL